MTGSDSVTAATADASDQKESRNASIQNIYNARALDYEDSWHSAFAKTFLTYVHDPPFSPGNRVIDLACGTGLITFLEAQQIAPSGNVFGVDFSEGMLDVARSKLKQLKPEEASCMRFINHDIADLDGIPEFQGFEQTYDLITCASAFVLLENPGAAVRQWARYLKPLTGCLILDVPHPNALRVNRIMETVADKLQIPFPLANRKWMITQESLRTMLLSTGVFQVEVVDFVEQQGWKVRRHGADRATAEKLWEECIHEKFTAVLLKNDCKDEAKEEFVQEWARSAEEDGFVEEIDGVFVVVAKRTL